MQEICSSWMICWTWNGAMVTGCTSSWATVARQVGQQGCWQARRDRFSYQNSKLWCKPVSPWTFMSMFSFHFQFDDRLGEKTWFTYSFSWLVYQPSCFTATQCCDFLVNQWIIWGPKKFGPSQVMWINCDCPSSCGKTFAKNGLCENILVSTGSYDETDGLMLLWNKWTDAGGYFRNVVKPRIFNQHLVIFNTDSW